MAPGAPSADKIREATEKAIEYARKELEKIEQRLPEDLRGNWNDALFAKLGKLAADALAADLLAAVAAEVANAIKQGHGKSRKNRVSLA